jgi:hypothetical protein
MTNRVTREEWRWVTLVALVVAALTSVPYVVGWAASTPESVFGGFVFAVEDGNSYLAKMGLGARGEWLYRDMYTPEAHDAGLFFLFHVLLGKLAALGGASLVFTYHAARLAFGFVMLLVTYRFMAAFTPLRRVRQFAFVLVAAAGGSGWLLVGLGAHNWLNSPPLDVYLPEGYGFLALMGFPHLSAARALLLGGLLLLLRAFESGRARYAVATGLAWLAMGLIVPFYVVIAGVVVLGYLVARHLPPRPRMGEGPGVRSPLPHAMLAGLIAAPAVVYSVVAFSTNPVFRAWSQQNIIISPHPLHYVLGYLVPALLAIPGARMAWRKGSHGRLLVTWVVIAPLLVYAPFNLQRRLIEGFQVALSLLAAYGFYVGLAPWWRARRPRVAASMAATALVVVLAVTPIMLVIGGTAAALTHDEPIFHSAAELNALDWLDRNAPRGALVLSAYETGNYLPARAGVRAFLGLGPETVDLPAKRKLVAAFYAGESTALVHTYGVGYVIAGPRERALGSFELDAAPFLERVYSNGDYAVYRVIAD